MSSPYLSNIDAEKSTLDKKIKDKSKHTHTHTHHTHPPIHPIHTLIPNEFNSKIKKKIPNW